MTDDTLLDDLKDYLFMLEEDHYSSDYLSKLINRAIQELERLKK